MEYETSRKIVSKEDVAAGLLATLLASFEADSDRKKEYIRAVADGLIELADKYDELKGTDKQIEMRAFGRHFGVLRWEDGVFVMHCLPKEEKSEKE